MKHYNNSEWQEMLENRIKELLNKEPISFKDLNSKDLKNETAVYLITEIVEKEHEALYVGRTTKFRQRIYQNHLNGDKTNASFKKYLMLDNENLTDLNLAKDYMISKCFVRWIEVVGIRESAAIEAFIQGRLFPKFGLIRENYNKKIIQ